jgi:hypothetical protein
MKRFIASSTLIGALALMPVTRAQERPVVEGAAPVDSLATTAPVVTVSALERLLLGRSVARAPGSRDPFSTTDRMQQLAGTTGEPRFVPNAGIVIPKLSLRGYVEPRGKPACALIEIVGQGTYVVRAGDTIGLTISGRSTVLKVVSLEASSAHIEAGSLGQVIVVR